jgi:hypothetical protein
MTTAFQTGPGFYAAASRKADKSLPPGTVRIYCARLEAYDLPRAAEEHELKTEFKLLVAMAEEKPAIARALLQLHGALNANIDLLRSLAP